MSVRPNDVNNQINIVVQGFPNVLVRDLQNKAVTLGPTLSKRILIWTHVVMYHMVPLINLLQLMLRLFFDKHLRDHVGTKEIIRLMKYLSIFHICYNYLS